MRKVVLYSLLSMDGVAEHPDQYILDWDDAMDAHLARVIESQDAVLLGRGSYDDWAPFWPTSEIQPFADFINGVEKYVFTSTPPAEPWAKTTVVGTDAVEFVRELKTQPGRDIGLHASINLSRSLLTAGLVDEMRLVIAPTVAGRGRRLFPDAAETQRWRLVDVEGTSSGAVLAHYSGKLAHLSGE
ncbi:dihydrofolate reductase family protein [Actinoplanes sp. NPDC051861]|uniref:dihydrofolate reductase family protein n=1 Tax=Actinoplanes sp. NPDC051861 TaxID=3155170 RepID=UPI00343C9136